MHAAIEAHSLVKRFGDTAVVDVSFEVRAGEIFGVVGPDGAGKTTLFRLLATLLPPTSGSAAIDGVDLVTRAPEVRRSIGVVPREAVSALELTVEENLRTFATVHGVPRATVNERMPALLAAVELAPFAGTPVRSLPEGVRRRVEIARALMHQPRVLLLDEPTAGLDAASRTAAWSVLKKVLSRRDLTVLLTTHDLDEARMLCTRVGVLHHGRLQPPDPA